MASSPVFRLDEGSTGHRTYKWIGIALFVVVLLLLAFAFNDTGKIELFDNGYAISTKKLTTAVAFIIAILGLQVVAGFTGQLSLGQGFFVGTGGYLSAWLVADQHWSYFASLLVVVPVCFLLGMVFGIPALRIRGLYLALVTLGLAAIFPSIVQLEQLFKYTNGAGGKTVPYKFIAPEWLPLDGIAKVLQGIPVIGDWFGNGDLSGNQSNNVYTFLLMSALAAVCFLLVNNLVKSRPGRAFRAIRDNETSAAVTGMNLSLYKTLSFGVASALGGVGGMVYVAEVGIASPGDFTQLLSILFIVGLVVGGVGTLSGAIVGGLAIVFIPDWSSSTKSLPGVPEKWLAGPTGNLILGALLIILTFVLPGGIVSGFRKLKSRFVQIVPRTPDLAVGDGPNGPSGTPIGASTADRATISAQTEPAGTAVSSRTDSTELS